ncbi:MAG: MerR family transcriptional regulator [Defluviitaleaceae bacterium]|nr:MerR family transcriptional regulator [Defluviitaleaceae bacterium]
MSDLVKIKDMSSKYGVSARTLRYYEDTGLITSTRTGDYAYRLYNEAAVKKLEQILILRKLNVNIKDIRRIFDSSDSNTVLEVLSKKVEDIDSEVSLLHELKEIVFTFIRYIQEADFNKESDVKTLYDKTKEIETQIANVEYEGHPSSTRKLLESASNANLRKSRRQPSGKSAALSRFSRCVVDDDFRDSYSPNRKTITNVDLKKTVAKYFDDEPAGGYTSRHSFTSQEELVITSHGHNESDYLALESSEVFKLPLRIDVVAKSTSEIWLHYNKGGLALNHDTNGMYYIHANDIFTGQHKSYPMGKLPICDYIEISWVLDYSESNVYINGEHFHTHIWPSAIPLAEKTKVVAPVDVCAGNANTVTVKSIKVTETQSTTHDINRLLEVTEQYNKRLHNESVLVVNLPKCKAVTSGWQWWDDLFKKGSFDDWLKANPHLQKEAFGGNAVYCVDKQANFHYDKACMNVTVHDNTTAADAAPYELIDFEGGLYAALHYPMGSQYCDDMYNIITRWLEDTGFEYDKTRHMVSQEIYGAFKEIEKGLGCHQLQRHVPIRLRDISPDLPAPRPN